MNDLISIVIPVYNVESYLERCIDSVLMQTYKNIEVILVNDGSTDNSLEICKRYYDNNISVVKIVNKLNGGLSSARNEGLRYCHGNYVCFIDSDDYVDEKFIEILYKNSLKYNAEVSCCGFKRTSADNEQGGYLSEKVINGNENIIDYYLSNEMTSAWGKLYKKDLFQHIKFPEGKIYEDIATNFQILKCVNSMVVSESKLYMYFVRTGSITVKPFRLNNFHLLDAWNSVVDDTKIYNDRIIAKAEYRRNRVYFTLLGVIARYGFDSKLDYCERKKIITKLRNSFDDCFIELVLSSLTTCNRKVIMVCFWLNYEFCCRMGAFYRKFSNKY